MSERSKFPSLFTTDLKHGSTIDSVKGADNTEWYSPSLPRLLDGS